jgi:amino acid permease
MGGPDVTQTHSAAHGRSQEEQLQRSVTGRLLFFYVLGDVLGSGIYALIGIMAFEVGGALWMSFVVGVSIALLTGFAYAELITKHPQAAGASLYVHKAFGPAPTDLPRHVLPPGGDHRGGGCALSDVRR